MNIVYTLLVALVGFLIAKLLKLPAPAMIGSMIAVGAFNIITDVAFMPVFLKMFTQGIAGIFIGLQLKIDDVKNIKKMAKPIGLLMLLFTLNTFITGNIIAIVGKMDIATALLSSVAGGVTDMSLISIDMNATTATVALMQTSRLISALLIFPMWIVFFSKKANLPDYEDDVKLDTIKNKSDSNQNNWKMVVTIGIAFLAGYLGNLSGIPAGPLVFSMFTIMILNSFTNIIYIKRSVKVVGQLFAGSLVGSTMTRSTFIELPQLILPIIILLFSYWLVNFIYGYLASKWKYLDMKSALFASCPAGASDMALIASDLGADLAKIGLIQVVRLVYAIAIMPQLVNLYINIFVN